MHPARIMERYQYLSLEKIANKILFGKLIASFEGVFGYKTLDHTCNWGGVAFSKRNYMLGAKQKVQIQII